MDDGLDAFLEAAGGAVRVEVPRRPVSDLEALQGKACHLLGVWSAPTPEYVVVGDHPVPSPLLVSAAALEIAVHGWDVGRATGALPGPARRPRAGADARRPGGRAAGGPAGPVRGPAADRSDGRIGRRAARIPGPLLIRPVGPGIHIWDKVPPNPSP